MLDALNLTDNDSDNFNETERVKKIFNFIHNASQDELYDWLSTLNPYSKAWYLEYAILLEKPTIIDLFLNLSYPLIGYQNEICPILIWTIVLHQSDLFYRLLEMDIDLEARYDDKNGLTPLMIAAGLGKSEYVSSLLLKDAQIEAINYFGQNAAMLAALRGETDCLKILIHHDTNLNAQDQDGNTILDHAKEYNQFHCIEIIEQAMAAKKPASEFYSSYFPHIRQIERSYTIDASTETDSDLESLENPYSPHSPY